MITKTTKYWLAGIGGLLVLLILISGLISVFFQDNNPVSMYDDISFDGGVVGLGEMTLSQPMSEPTLSRSMATTPGLDYEEAADKDRDVIKTGSITMQVEKIDDSIPQLQAIAKNYGGDVINQSINTYESDRRGYVTLRVEENNFETAYNDIKQLGSQILYEDITADDVTEQVVDLEARLSNARLEEESYLNVLNRAQTVEDILKVQSYLSTVREKIERYEAQLEYYSNQTSYSHISINLTEEVSVTFERDEFRPWQDVKNAVQSVIELFQNLLIALIYLVIVGGAIIIPILIIFAILRLIVKKFKSKKK